MKRQQLATRRRAATKNTHDSIISELNLFQLKILSRLVIAFPAKDEKPTTTKLYNENKNKIVFFFERSPRIIIKLCERASERTNDTYDSIILLKLCHIIYIPFIHILRICASGFLYIFLFIYSFFMWFWNSRPTFDGKPIIPWYRYQSLEWVRAHIRPSKMKWNAKVLHTVHINWHTNIHNTRFMTHLTAEKPEEEDVKENRKQ